MDRQKSISNTPVIVAVALILILAFAISLFAALSALGEADGEIKISGGQSGELFSAGAPRSQLALKQMFDAMSTVRSNGNKTLYEPITEEYLAVVSDRIDKGERPMLSVEEVLYIISDTVTLAEKYDGVTLHGIGTVLFRKSDSSRPIHIAAIENCQSIIQTVIYRIKSLCISDATEQNGEVFTYYPDGDSRDPDRRRFVFTPAKDGSIGMNIVFFPGDGQCIDLFPSPEITDLCNTKYMSVSSAELTQREMEILSASGLESSQCRSVTPEYWKGLTDCRLVVVAGRIVIIDPESGTAVDSAPDGMRTISLALGDSDGDKKYELYFTAFADGCCKAIKYVPGSGAAEILLEKDFCIGAYEDADTHGVSFYRTEQVESGSYLNLLHRIGSAIEN